MHIVACFKRLQKKEIKEVWLGSYFINISSWSNKFIPNNWFGEAIIILNKENINLFVNAKSNEFFYKTVLQNVLSLYNSKEALLQATGSTKNSNCHLIVGSNPDIYYLVKFLINKAVFHKLLRKSNSRSNLPNLFVNSSTLLVKKVLLSEYIANCQSNWVADTKPQKNNNENDLATWNDNVDIDIMKKQAKKIEIDYNQS